MNDKEEGYLGIDIGTQGLSVVWTDVNLHVVATADSDHAYDFLPNLPPGHYEQHCADWDAALRSALHRLQEKLNSTGDCSTGRSRSIHPLAIGISGHMHGAVLADAKGTALTSVRLWCDTRNQEDGRVLTQTLQTKVPQRATAARWRGIVRDAIASGSDVPHRTAHLTTPAGWIAYRLTGDWTLGIGDAAGMFPIDPKTQTFDPQQLQVFDNALLSGLESSSSSPPPPLGSLLPIVEHVNSPAVHRVTAAAAQEFGVLPEGTPVAAAEGDQVAALAGSLIGTPGAVACSFGTSVCANVVADNTAAPFVGIAPAVDHFCAADGAPIHMVWLQNGTTFLNAMVQAYTLTGESSDDAFATAMPALLAAPPDCGGLLALPFLDDEPGVLGRNPNDDTRTTAAMIVGWTSTNANIGNIAKAALLATMFNLKLGCKILQDQDIPLTELILTGGLTKTPACGQILADVFDRPVTLLDDSADEGSGWGAAVIAKYKHLSTTAVANEQPTWPAFLQLLGQATSRTRFDPEPSAVKEYQAVFQRYQQLLALHRQIAAAVATEQ